LVLKRFKDDYFDINDKERFGHPTVVKEDELRKDRKKLRNNEKYFY